jgi:formiminotetrahydrofolate cyclodeaminase
MSRLVDLSVREFVDAVASADHSVPAGGSVAALSGAASAALLALVCGVIQRRAPGELDAELRALEGHQRELLDLVDEDAAAFDDFMQARRRKRGVPQAIERITRIPLAIGNACMEIIQLSDEVEGHEIRHMHGDVRAARHLAQAAVRTALDIAEANVPLQQDAAARATLLEQIANLRVKASI